MLQRGNEQSVAGTVTDSRTRTDGDLAEPAGGAGQGISARTRDGELGLLVMGQEAGRHGFLGRLPVTRSAEEGFDAVVLVSPVAEAEIYDSLAVQGRLLAPVVNLSGTHVAREDFFHPYPSELAFQEGMAAVAPIVARLRELPELGATPDRAGLLVLALAYTRQSAIEARLDGSVPDLVDYPLLRGVVNAPVLLGELARAELLRGRFFQRLHLCGSCGSARVNAREECAECRSSHLQEDTVVHHYRCGHQGPEQTFLRDGELTCPKCRHVLRHYAVDYDKPGVVQTCLSCGHTMSEPAVGFLCADCGRQQDASAADTRDWYHYDPLPAAMDALSLGLLPHRSFSSLMQQRYGALSVRDFLGAADVVVRVARRYGRPLAALRLEVTNAAELRAALGGRGLSAVFSRLGELISHILRESDLVTATNDSLYALLPETPADLAGVVVGRIREGVHANISEPVAFEVRTFGGDDLDQMLAGLR